MGHIHFDNQPKYKWPVRIAFAAAGLGIAAAGLWYAANNNKAEQSVTTDPAPHTPRTYGENISGFIKETVPDQITDTDPSQTSRAGSEPANPKELSPQELEDKQVMINLAKDYYEEMLRETDPIRRYDRVARMRSVAVYVGDDALSALGMTKDQLEGLVKSLQMQAGPAVLEYVRKMDKYDSAKIEKVVTMIEIANSLSSSDRGRYYESLGSSRAELQEYYCDGVVAEARSDMAFALSNKADEMTQNDYDYRFLSLIQSLARNMPDGYSKVCNAAGRNVYQESGISDQQIKQLLAFKPKIIPG